MNFLKGSLFRRNTEPEELEPMEESGGGILAVWGSPGCGKTVTAVKIAKHLASQKKNTALLPQSKPMDEGDSPNGFLFLISRMEYLLPGRASESVMESIALPPDV